MVRIFRYWNIYKRIYLYLSSLLSKRENYELIATNIFPFNSTLIVSLYIIDTVACKFNGDSTRDITSGTLSTFQRMLKLLLALSQLFDAIYFDLLSIRKSKMINKLDIWIMISFNCYSQRSLLYYNIYYLDHQE